MEIEKPKIVILSIEENQEPLSETTVLTQNGPSGEGIRRVDSEDHSVAVDARNDDIEEFIAGKTIKNEEGTKKTCEILVSKLNYDDGDWFGLISPTEADAVDGRPYSRGKEKQPLQIQVTKADQSIWAELAKKKSGIQRRRRIDDVCASLLEAILKKQYVDGRDKLVLALEAVHLPVNEAVADRFIETAKGKAKAIGFKQIWLVGPSALHTYRLA